MYMNKDIILNNPEEMLNGSGVEYLRNKKEGGMKQEVKNLLLGHWLLLFERKVSTFSANILQQVLPLKIKILNSFLFVKLTQYHV